MFGRAASLSGWPAQASADTRGAGSARVANWTSWTRNSTPTNRVRASWMRGQGRCRRPSSDQRRSTTRSTTPAMNGIASTGVFAATRPIRTMAATRLPRSRPRSQIAITVTTSDTTTITTKLRAAAAGSTRPTVYACSSHARPSNRGYQPKRVIAPNRRPSGWVMSTPVLDASGTRPAWCRRPAGDRWSSTRARRLPGTRFPCSRGTRPPGLPGADRPSGRPWAPIR